MTSQRHLEDLKIAALTTGTRVSDAALAALGGAANVTVHEYATTGGIPLRVEGLDMNAPFDEWFCADAEVEVDVDPNVDTDFDTDADFRGLILRYRGDEFAVDLVHPLPGYLGRTDAVGRRFDEVVFTHIDRLRLSPISGCAYDCHFCDMPGRVRLHPVDQLLAAAEEAMSDDRLSVRHALLSGGSPGPRHEAAFADTLVQVVAALSPVIEIDVMMSSGQGTVDLVRRLVDAGVHGFALNIEVESTEASEVYVRGKHRWARPYFDDTVRVAVELCGSSGRVRSLILPGLEPLASTLAGVEHIAALGADPVLSPFRPARNTLLSQHPPLSSTLLRDVLDGSREIVGRYGVSLGPRCLPCQHNTLSFPWDVPTP